MREASGRDITQHLRAWKQGDGEAFDLLLPLVYPELKRLARRQRARVRPDETLNTTGLVHDAYLKLVGRSSAEIRDRQHFFCLAARVMRQIVVDHAREKGALKRGGGQAPLSLDGRAIPVEARADAVLSVHQALERLEALDPRAVRVVECRFFAGLTSEETADSLGIGHATVERTWTRARAWLRKALTAEAAP